MKNTKLSREENVARGYAVINPNGEYKRPPAMNQEMRDKVDSGYVKLSAWGKIELTDKYDLEIKALQKPSLKNPLFTGDQVDTMLGSILLQDMQELKTQIVNQFPESVNSVVYLLEDKPAKLVEMEAQLNQMFNNYWTPERKAIAKQNQQAQYAYEVAVITLENAKSATLAKIAKADSYIQNAIERKNNPVLAASQNKIAAIIEDKKRSSEDKLNAIAEGNKSAGASYNAKRDIVVAISKLIGAGLDKDAIFSRISVMDEFSALAYKRPEKEFNRLYKDTVNWIYYMNCNRVFWDVIGWVSEGINNTMIRKDNKTCLPQLLAFVAMHQAKDNNARALMAFRYVSRITIVSHANSEVDARTLGRKFEKYAEFNYINYAKGEQGGIASRVGLKEFKGTLTEDQINKAKKAILDSFTESPFYAQLEAVLNLIDGKPAYDNQDLQNAVTALLEVFVPLTRKAADDRIAERALESVDFEAAKETYLVEQEERIKKHLESGLGFQPRRKASLALSD